MHNILLTGLNHKVAHVELRERLSFSPEQAKAFMNRTLDHAGGAENPLIQESALLATCNRTEIYVCADNTSAAQKHLYRLLADHAHLPISQLEDVLYIKSGEDAARHLFYVALGLDSMVLGENEILGQVRDACEAAGVVGTAGTVLSTLFRYAVHAGKRARAETDIHNTGASIVTTIIEIAGQKLGKLDEKTALIIGAGKISSLAARALVKARLECVLVANRTYERAQKLAQSIGGTTIHFDDLEESLKQADIVICSTGAPHIVLHYETVREAMRARPGRPLFVADLAVPRDADPQIRSLHGVDLVDIDSLGTSVHNQQRPTLAACRAAEQIAEQELQKFAAWYSTRRNAPVIAALRAHAQAICDLQTAQTLRRLGDLTPHQRRAVETLGHTIIGKLLHTPITHLKSPPPGMSVEDYTQLVQDLFGLNRG